MTSTLVDSVSTSRGTFTLEEIARLRVLVGMPMSRWEQKDVELWDRVSTKDPGRSVVLIRDVMDMLDEVDAIHMARKAEYQRNNPPKPQPVTEVGKSYQYIPISVGDIWVLAPVLGRSEREIEITVVIGDIIGYRAVLPGTGEWSGRENWKTRTDLLGRVLGDKPVGWVTRGWFGRKCRHYGEKPINKVFISDRCAVCGGRPAG